MNFITAAYAQSAGATSATDLLTQMAPFAIILVIMYFLILRPQQQRAKSHQSLVSNLRRNDTVVTAGGIVGKISRTLDDNEVEIEIAPNVKVRQLRSLVTEVRVRAEAPKE